MKCKSCEGEVPPKFAHAIAMNCCPLCGDEIMDELLRTSLTSLKTAMDAAAAYPAEIFDWLQSNYRLYTEDAVNAKVVEAEERVRESSRKLFEKPSLAAMQKAAIDNPGEIKSDPDGNQIKGQTLQGADQTSIFFKNAQATRSLNNQDKFKEMIKQIKNSNANGGGGGDGGGGMGEVDPQELAELNAAFGNPAGDINSGLDPADIDYEDEIPDIVLNMAGGGGGIQKDLLKLQNLQHKSASAKNQIAKTGSVGMIRR